MNERSQMAARPAPRRLVDELPSVFAKLAQRFGQVRDAVGDVVEAGAPTLQVAVQGTLLAGRLEELDLSNEGDVHAVGG